MSVANNGEIYNLCGNEQNNVLQVLRVLEEITGVKAKVRFHEERLGDQQETRSVAKKAHQQLKFSPKFSLREGLLKQVEWQNPN